MLWSSFLCKFFIFFYIVLVWKKRHTVERQFMLKLTSIFQVHLRERERKKTQKIIFEKQAAPSLVADYILAAT